MESSGDDGGVGGTTKSMCLMPLIVRLEMVKMVNFVFYVLCHNSKRFYFLKESNVLDFKKKTF